MESPTREQILVAGSRELVVLLLTIGLFWWLQKRYDLVRRFLFEKRGPMDLAIARIVIFAVVAVNLNPIILYRFAGLDPALHAPPFGWGSLVNFLPMSSASITIALVLMYGGCLLSVLGLAYRQASWVATLSAFYLYSVAQMFGKVDHDHHLILFSLILCFAPASDVWSLDNLLARRKTKSEGGSAVKSEPASLWCTSIWYGLPLTAISIVIALAYYFPGLWKVARAWTLWFDGQNLGMIIRSIQESNGSTDFQNWLLHQNSLLVFGAIATIVFELGFIFLILTPRMRVWGVIMGIGFHTAILLSLHINFINMEFCYAALIPWTAIVAKLKAHAVRAEDCDKSLKELRGTPIGIATSVIALGLFLMGAARRTDGWPIACYPTFDGTSADVSRKLLLAGQGAEGKPTQVDLTFDPSLCAFYGPSVWRAMADPWRKPFSNQRAKALFLIWERNSGIQLQNAALYSVTFKTSEPGTELKRELIWKADGTSGLVSNPRRTDSEMRLSSMASIDPTPGGVQ